MSRVNPEILVWARKTAGLSLSEAASKLNIRAAYGKTAEARLRQLENGEVVPSRSLIHRMSGQYRRPLVAFYLAEPPRRGNRGQDFRLLPVYNPPASEGILDALVRHTVARQGLMRATLIDEKEARELPFVASLDISDGLDRVLETLNTILDLTRNDLRMAPNPMRGFEMLRERAERSGVFVLLLGNLGSHHTSLDVDSFRGFAIADDVAPFVLINDQDSPAAWSFTLLHELTHLILGQTGISGGSVAQDIEKFCNDVASRFLLGSDELSEFESVNLQDQHVGSEYIEKFAHNRNLSRSMVAYRLFRSGFITEPQWQAYQKPFKNLWITRRESKRQRARETARGPSYYVVKRHRLGTALLETTARFLSSGALSTTKAGTVLGVKPSNIPRLLQQYM